jgi:hypothetical protein
VLHLLADGWLNLRPVSGNGRASRFKPVSTDTWIGLDGYYAGETLRVERRADGTPSHLDLATFVFTRTPYDSAAPVPGGVAGWRSGESLGWDEPGGTRSRVDLGETANQNGNADSAE